MKTRLRAGEVRTVIIGGVIGALILAQLRLLPLVRDWYEETRAAARELEGELALARANIAALPALGDSLIARREELLRLAPSLLPGQGTSATTALTAVVSGAVQRANLRLGALRARMDTLATEPFGRVTVQADVTGDIRGLAALLLELDRSSTLLVVRRLSVTQRQAAAPSDQSEELHLEVVVEALAVVKSAAETRR